ncbi:7-carboxy-7-deazaguanine synthase QueE [Halalkalibacter urbisdiaboli]|uniref:7-carboxy-7-deazaguanine synthase QueE n=1 Tax=Halalkalibacter urbisdiaboli TaxID=1960589 RepID=UPI000B4502A2|nr:7-carboxy-7-deazaguanine synthase QueE [Halalkalibacter urbisdiaboli]
MKKIPVMEIFGPTIQGEGKVIGQKTMFVRTAGCDYSCSWCDSRFTWDGTGKSTLMSATQIWERLVETGASAFSHVTISGGNPALHQGLSELVNLLKSKGIKTAVETQGTVWQDWLTDVDDVTVSPKPPSSGMVTDVERLDMFMNSLKPEQMSMKIVIFNEGDFKYAEQLRNRYKDVSFFLQVGNKDIETTENEQLLTKLIGQYEWLINQVIESTIMNDVRVLPQLHTLVWGNKRGV